jgi:hypothetical protein
MWKRTAAQNTKKVDKKALCRRCGNELNCSSAETSPFRSSTHHPDRVSLKYVEILRVAIHDILVWIRIRGSSPLTKGFKIFSAYYIIFQI